LAALDARQNDFLKEYSFPSSPSSGRSISTNPTSSAPASRHSLAEPVSV